MKFENLADLANEQSGILELVRPTKHTNKTDLCYDCEETIDAKRMTAIPGVELCIHCQRDLEKTGAGRVKAS